MRSHDRLDRVRTYQDDLLVAGVLGPEPYAPMAFACSLRKASLSRILVPLNSKMSTPRYVISCPPAGVPLNVHLNDATVADDERLDVAVVGVGVHREEGRHAPPDLVNPQERRPVIVRTHGAKIRAVGREEGQDPLDVVGIPGCP